MARHDKHKLSYLHPCQQLLFAYILANEPPLCPSIFPAGTWSCLESQLHIAGYELTMEDEP
jgi:hypothetical protein